MRLAALAATISLIFLFGRAEAQGLSGDLDECSRLLAKTEQRVGVLTKHEMSHLLNSVDEHCMSSTEFSEWVNEMLYAALVGQPRLFAETFSGIQREKKDRISNELARPVHDGIDIEGAYVALENAGDDLASKGELSRAIEQAAEISGLSLQ